MVEHNHIPEMVSEVVRGKALATIVEAAVVTDESGRHVELANLRPDGSIGDPADETPDDTSDVTPDDAQADGADGSNEGTDEAPENA
jgi:trigger factor